MTVLVGSKSLIAIEADIACAFEERSLIGLGYFQIYLDGVGYGERRHDATFLANSLDEVKRRLEKRGAHVADFSFGVSAEEIAHAYCDGIYGDAPTSRKYFGLPLDNFLNVVYGNEIIWAPDGDAAFDDGSNVLQFDSGELVRVIGFKRSEAGEVMLVRDVIIEENRFYRILSTWVELFEKTWAHLPKNPSMRSH